MSFDRQRLFRWALKTRPFARFYGRVIGPASVAMFTEALEVPLLQALPPRARVLEVGCGPGLQAIAVMRRRPDLQLVASDFSAAFVELSTRNAERELDAEARGALRFQVADAMDLSAFSEESFDAVYSVTAIKHFPEPVRGLRECLRVLRPGGRLLVAEIRRESSLEEVAHLAVRFQLPAWLRGMAARFVHGSLREECPPMEAVEAWFGALAGEAHDIEVGPLSGRPAWLATATKGVPSRLV